MKRGSVLVNPSRDDFFISHLPNTILILLKVRSVMMSQSKASQISRIHLHTSATSVYLHNYDFYELDDQQTLHWRLVSKKLILVVYFIVTNTVSG